MYRVACMIQNVVGGGRTHYDGCAVYRQAQLLSSLPMMGLELRHYTKPATTVAVTNHARDW